MSQTPRSLRVVAADDLTLHALEWSQSGPPFVLLHGFSNEAHIWDDIAPTLAPYYRTLAIDLRGHGDSDWDSTARYDYDHHVADLGALYKALGIERAVLCGHSFGGRVATLFAGQHPERVAGLIVIDSGPEHDPRGSTRIRFENESIDRREVLTREGFRARMARNYPAASPHVVDRLAKYGVREDEGGGVSVKMDPNFLRRAADKAGASTDVDANAKRLWQALERVDCPTLVLRGAASDVLSADTAEMMVERLSHGQLVTIAQAGHSVMTDNPDACMSAISDFALSDA